MKLISSLILSLCLFSASLFASPVEREGLKEAMQELNYSLTVEWNQDDSKFYVDQITKFQDRINQLGLKNLDRNEAFMIALSQVKDGQYKSNVQATLSKINVNHLSNEEVQALLIQIAEKTNSVGSSWNGREYVPFLVIISAFTAITVTLGVATDYL